MSRDYRRREKERQQEAREFEERLARQVRFDAVWQVPTCAKAEFLQVVDCLGEPAANAILGLIDALMIPRRRED